METWERVALTQMPEWQETARLRVPGGWLYRELFVRVGTAPAIGLVFVPDAVGVPADDEPPTPLLAETATADAPAGFVPPAKSPPPRKFYGWNGPVDPDTIGEDCPGAVCRATYGGTPGTILPSKGETLCETCRVKS